MSTCVASPCDTNDGQHYVQEKSHSEKSQKSPTLSFNYSQGCQFGKLFTLSNSPRTTQSVKKLVLKPDFVRKNNKF